MSTNNPQNSFQLLKILWKYLLPKRKKQIKLLLILMIGSAFGEIFTIAAIFPFLSALTNPEELLKFKIIENLAGYLDINEVGNMIYPISIIFGLTAIFSSSIRILNLWASTRIAAAVGTDLSCESYKRTLYQPYIVHTTRNTSEMVANSTFNIELAVNVINKALELITALIIAFFILSFLLYLNPIPVFISIIIFIICYGILSLSVRKNLLKNSLKIANSIKEEVKVTQEGLGAIRDVIITNSQNLYIKNFKNADYPLRRLQAKNLFLGLSPRYLIEAIGLIVITLLSLKISNNAQDKALILSTIGTLALGFQRLLPTFQLIYSTWASIKANSECVKNVLKMLEQPLPKKRLISENINFKKAIVLEKIVFKYPDTSKIALDSINLKINFGEKIGIIGSSGSGKSTLMDLLIGLIEPNSGKLIVDGIDIFDKKNFQFLLSWRSSIANVSQSIYLSDNTIYENIAFGLNLKDINTDLVKECARQANIAEHIEKYPLNYRTIIGERGIKLSGGQRQRLGIARALYHKKNILFLDEATSALDTKTESKIMKTINQLDEKITIVMIAHRLSTLDNFDRIIKVENGKIV